MVRAIYNLILFLFWLLRPFFVIFSPKFGKRERDWEEILGKNKEKILSSRSGKTIWIHSASMGEFEQAKPIIEYLKKLDDNVFVVATFFSPSGYENQREYKFADVLLYLPLDFPKQSRKFIDLIKPNIAIFIRYELWLNYLSELKQRNIPAFLISASKPKNADNTIYRRYLKTCLELFTKIYPMDKKDFEYFVALDLKVPIELAYDTRFDRVNTKIQNLDDIPFQKADLGGDFVLIAGSIWKEDINLILEAYNLIKSEINLRIIYVPHEPKEDIIRELESKDKNTIKFSQILEKPVNFKYYGGKNIIVDKIGYLLSLYSLGDVAYVGGGFARGVHSVVEPAGFGIPIICGGRIDNSIDAMNLKDLGVLQVVDDGKSLAMVLLHLRDKSYYKDIQEKVKNYFSER
ncbi:MAG: 3-deoxy-D-manno-octulosonic acid transferase, partial [Candidatus Kapaibacteriota bacterium]